MKTCGVSVRAASRLLGIFLSVSILAGCAGGASSSSLLGKPAPAYTPFFILDDQPVILENFKGKNVVILFWAATCNQSHEIVKDLAEYARKNAKAKNLEVIAVSIDKLDDLPKLRERIQWGNIDGMRQSFSGNDIYDQAKVAFEVDSLPSLFVIDPKGVVIAGGSSMSVVTEALGE